MRVKFINTGRMLYSAVGGEGGGTPAVAAPPAAAAADPAAAAAAAAATAPAVPWGADPNAKWMIGDKPWYAHLPDGPTKELYAAKDYANPIVAADSHYSANKMVQAPDRTLVLPGENATETERQAFEQRLRAVKGALDAPEKYTFKMPEGVEADPTMTAFAQKIAHKYGLSPTEAQGMVDEWNKDMGAVGTDAVAKMQQANELAIGELKTKHGAHFDEFVAGGKRVVQSLGLAPELLNKVEAQIGAAPLVELLCAIGAKTGEGSFVNQGSTGGAPTDPSAMSPAQAKAAIDAMRGDPATDKILNDKLHPQHREMVDKLAALYARV